VLLLGGLLVSTPSPALAASTPEVKVSTVNAGDAPLKGTVIDLIGVGAHYLGLVNSGDRLFVLRSADGRSWTAFAPKDLSGVPPVAFGALPGGLNRVRHVLFTDGKAVYLRTQAGSTFNALGTTRLFVSDATGRAWHELSLPAPDGKGAFPIAAQRMGKVSYLGGAVYDPIYGQSYLDAAVWSSTDGASWAAIDSPALVGDNNQTIFGLAQVDGALVAGGGDSSLITPGTCCYYADGIAFWRGIAGQQWSRVDVTQAPYDSYDSASVVGFRQQGQVVAAVVDGNRSATSETGGRTWTVNVQTPPTGKRAVFPPRVDATLRFDGRFIGTTTPAAFCADCNTGALATSVSGDNWKNVTPKFPCGQRQTRPSYGFLSAPEDIDDTVAALAGCGPNLMPFNRTLLTISDDGGRHWRFTDFNAKTGTPVTAVTGHHRIVTLAPTSATSEPSAIRAIIVS
jgi:hypothetical protein